MKIKASHAWYLAWLTAACPLAWGQEVPLLRDLDAAGRVTLSKQELEQLLPMAVIVS